MQTTLMFYIEVDYLTRYQYILPSEKSPINSLTVALLNSPFNG